MTESVLSRMETRCERGAPWQERVLDWARGYHALTRKHLFIVLPIINNPAAVGVAILLISETLYEAFEDAGLPDALIAVAADTLVDFLNGFALGGTEASRHDTSLLVSNRFAAEAPVLARVLNSSQGLSHRDSWSRVEAGVQMLIDGASTTAKNWRA